MATSHHVCGLFYFASGVRRYLPQVKLSAHVSIISSTSRTTLTQTFVNTDTSKPLDEVKYAFPLYDGVSVVGFTCTLGDRVIRGVVKEKQKARQVYQDAVERGETAGLLERVEEAGDVFLTSVGNVPAGASVKVEITFLGELKHDAEVDGIRFTLPSSISPRYGQYPGELVSASSTLPLIQHTLNGGGGIEITVDTEMPSGSAIRSIQSTSHPISVSIGTTSTAPSLEPSLQKASATLSLGSAELDKDFVMHVVATNTSNPVAVLEEHPTLPHQRALMATLVPKFSLPPERPEIVFVCDRSGSMGLGNKMGNLKTALQVFLKSMPVGVKFNICSFGSQYSMLWERSKTYSQSTLDEATRHVDGFQANFGGTEMYNPMEAIMAKRYSDMNLEVFLLTDGDIWNQQRLFDLVGTKVAESSGAIRVFTLGIGSDASSSLVEGVARVGNGFSQAVGDNEKMNSKVVRMLKGALSPHVSDYTLEVKYNGTGDDDGDDFELVDRVEDSSTVRVLDASARDKAETQAQTQTAPKKTISLFDTAASADAEESEAQAALGRNMDAKYDHLPSIPVPNLLQAPFRIPTLFPFSRTSVYVLMSESTKRQHVKSVVLRGTSAHGPLELEIPVTRLATPGETLHQLAARKAIGELEEGNGWLHHARDESDGKRLKDKYEGRLADMAEREAVRLGTRYQVGGKWCSFVAIEQSIGEGGVPLSETTREAFGIVDKGMRKAPDRVSAAPTTGHLRYRKAVDSSRQMPGGAVFVQQAQQQAQQQVQQQVQQLSAVAASRSSPWTSSAAALSPRPVFGGGQYSRGATAPPAPPPPTAPAAPMAPMASMAPPAFVSSRRSAADTDMECSMESSASSDELFGTPTAGRGGPSPAPSTSGLFGSAGPSMGPSMGPSLFGSSKPSSTGSGLLKSSLSLFGTNAKKSRAAPKAAALSAPVEASVPMPAPAPEDPLEAIVTLQTFEGFWSLSDELLLAIGISKDQLDSALVSHGATGSWTQVLASEPDRRMAATACVILFLQKKMPREKDTWEMMVDKASDWLSVAVAPLGVGVDEVEGALRSLF